MINAESTLGSYTVVFEVGSSDIRYGKIKSVSIKKIASLLLMEVGKMILNLLIRILQRFLSSSNTGTFLNTH